jgi:hypothetical protein
MFWIRSAQIRQNGENVDKLVDADGCDASCGRRFVNRELSADQAATLKGYALYEGGTPP